MYRSSDKAANEKFFNYLKESVAPISKDEANTAWNYYRKSNYLLDLQDYTRAVSKELTEVGFGNIETDAIIVLDTMNNKKALEFFRFIFKRVNIDFHNVYFTSLNKTSNNDLNTETLIKEIQCIKPKTVITLSSVSSTISPYNIGVPNLEIHSVNDMSFGEMLGMMDRDNLSEQENNRLVELKNYVWSKVKYIMTGYTPLVK